MRSYQEMAEAVFREGDARIAARRKRRKKALAGGAVGLAAAVCLALFGLLRGAPFTGQPTLVPAPATTTTVVTAARDETKQAKEADTTAQPAQPETTNGGAANETRQPSTTENRPSVNDARQPAGQQPSATEEPTGEPRTEAPTAGGRNGTQQEATNAALITTGPSEELSSGSSGAASYNSEYWTQAPVDQSGWVRFPRWPGYEDKFWVYYDGRTYRCDPFAGRPLAYGEYLCCLSDCAHDFADEDGAGVYVMKENGETVPVDTAVVIVFPDGGSYAMIRPDTD